MGVPLILSDVPDETPYIQYIATSNQTTFPYPFPITQDSDLVVVVNGVTLNTDSGYSLTGQGDDTGGNVVFTSGQAANTVVTLFRDIAIERISQIAQNSGFSSTVFNAEFNQIYLIMQQLETSIGLCLQIPNTNSPAPTTTLLPANYANKYLGFDSNGNPEPAVLTSSGSLTQSIIGGLLFPQSAAEASAGVTPVTYIYDVGDPRRYGAALDGVTDDTGALTNWAKVPGRHFFPIAATSLISGAISLVSNSTYEFAAGATIQTATHDISMFSASSKSGITIRGAHFKQTSAGTAALVGGVALVNCSNCRVLDCEFEGMQFSGIYASAVTQCTFRGNYMHDCLGTMQDSGDIYVESSNTTTSSYNIIDGNHCYGPTFEFGIAVWDPYNGVLPIHNIVCNNRVKAHNGYGILIYMPDSGDSYNQIIGNHIQDISAHSTNTDSGAGIYLAGAGIGGTQIIGNTCQNCCITTSTASLAPGGIGVNGSVSASAPVVVSGNTITDMSRYHGIIVTTCAGPVQVTGNTVRHPTQSSNLGHGIYVVNSNSIGVDANNIYLLTTTTNQEGIFLFATGANCTNISVTGNKITGGHHAQIRLDQSGGFTVQNFTLNGNVCSGGDSSCIPLILGTSAAAGGQVTGNQFIATGSVNAVQHNTCTNVRYSNNRLSNAGGASLATSGVCTASFFDFSNSGVAANAQLSNAATGFIAEVLGTAVPSAGTWAVGDLVRNSAPSTSGVLFWTNTVAGSPGTFKTVSNT